MFDKYVYFVYSTTYVKERNEIENKMGKVFVPGTVVVNGSRNEYSFITEMLDYNRYPDLRVIAEGNLNTFTYTNSYSKPKRG